MVLTVDKYIKQFSPTEQEILNELRRIILSVSKFEESIYYGMPGFKHKGKYVACFRVYANHVGFYPCSGTILHNFSTELKQYKTSIGAVQLSKEKKLPVALIKKIIIARMKEIDSGKKR